MRGRCTTLNVIVHLEHHFFSQLQKRFERIRHPQILKKRKDVQPQVIEYTF